MLGLYVSDHPLRGVERLLRTHAEHAVAQVVDDELGDGTPVRVAGMLSEVNRRITKQGKLWASAVIEDLTGAIEVLVFPQTFELVGSQLRDDLMVALKGRVSHRDTGSVSIIANDLMVLDASTMTEAQPLTISMRDTAVTPEAVERLKDVLAQHRGSTEVRLELRSATTRRSQLLRLGYSVEVTPALMADLKALVGAGSVS